MTRDEMRERAGRYYDAAWACGQLWVKAVDCGDEASARKFKRAWECAERHFCRWSDEADGEP